MTALLTDEQIIVACHNHAQAATRLMGDTEERQEHLEYAERDFEEGARFARSIYEARLAEDAKVRAQLVEALGVARTRFRLVMSAEGRGFGIDYIDGCAAAAIEEIDAALLTAEEIK